jgi:GABA(A) receptor-associated protein
MSLVEYKPFGKRKTLAERQEIFRKVNGRHPERIPIICEPSNGCRIELDKYKYLCPQEVPLGEFLHIIRKRMPKLRNGEAVFLLVNNVSPCNSRPLGVLYDEHKQEDGFLYLTYDSENTFG